MESSQQSCSKRIARLAQNKQVILTNPSASLCLVSKSGIQREVAEQSCKARGAFGYQEASQNKVFIQSKLAAET